MNGCGGGHLVNAGEAEGISCTGYDISKDLIELAIKYKNDAISVEHSNTLNFFQVDNEEQLISKVKDSKSKVCSLLVY